MMKVGRMCQLAVAAAAAVFVAALMFAPVAGCNITIPPWIHTPTNTPPVVVTNEPPVVTNAPPVSANDAIDWSKIRWVTDLPAPNAVLDTNAVLVSAWTDGNRLYVTWGPKWTWTPNDGFCDGFYSVYYDDGATGKWMGGRFEYCPIVRRAYIPWGAAMDPASGHVFPAQGKKLYAAVYSLNRARRSNTVLVTWGARNAKDAALAKAVEPPLKKSLLDEVRAKAKK